jgi:hypothetical protein
MVIRTVGTEVDEGDELATALPVGDGRELGLALATGVVPFEQATRVNIAATSAPFMPDSTARRESRYPTDEFQAPAESLSSASDFHRIQGA